MLKVVFEGPGVPPTFPLSAQAVRDDTPIGRMICAPSPYLDILHDWLDFDHATVVLKGLKMHAPSVWTSYDSN